MKKKKKFSLKFKFGFVIALIGIIPLTTVTVVSIGLARKTVLDSKNESLQNIAEAKKTTVESLLYSNYVNTRAIAEQQIFKSQNSTHVEIEEGLKRTHALYPEYDDLFIINLNGQVITSINYHYEGEWNEKDWFEKVKKGQTIISGVHTIINPFQTIVIFATPITDDEGNIKSILATQLPIDKIWASLEISAANKNNFTNLVDERNIIIYDPNQKKLFNPLPVEIVQNSQNISGIFQTVQEGEMFLVGYATIKNDRFPELNWKMYAFEKKSETLKALSSLETYVIIITVILLLAATIFGFYFGFQFLKPIEKLKIAATNLGKGKLNVRTNIKAHDEFQELSEIFNEMAEKIEDLSKNLEKKIKQKTKELEENNKILEETNAAMVGREFRIIELKKEISKLNQELENKKDTNLD